MMRHTYAFATLLASAGLFFTPVTIADDATGITRAAVLSNTCAGCHGPNGVSAGSPIPSIAGISAVSMEMIMQAFKTDKRPATVMNRIAKGYSDEDIKEIATFFAAQKPAGVKQDFDAGLAEKGKALHEASCAMCHAEGGKKDMAGSGILAGQWKEYLEISMADFISGARQGPAPMVDALKKADGDGSLKALIEYYASQQ